MKGLGSGALALVIYEAGSGESPSSPSRPYADARSMVSRLRHGSIGYFSLVSLATFSPQPRCLSTLGAMNPTKQPPTKNPEHLLIFAAGNAGDGDGVSTTCTIGSPAIGKNVLAVGSSSSGETQLPVTDADGELLGSTTQTSFADIDTVSFFSSRGPTTDGRIKPEIVAPGDRVRRTSDVSHKLAADDILAAAEEISATFGPGGGPRGRRLCPA